MNSPIRSVIASRTRNDPVNALAGRRARLRPVPVLLGSALLLAACGEIPPFGSTTRGVQDSGPAHPVDLSHVADAIPRREPRSRYGNPQSYTVAGRTYRVMADGRGFVEEGIASWYGRKFHGRRTSSGEPYDMYAMTAAHKTLPLPTYVEVRNLDNGRRAIVRVNDRGPFKPDRIIDLSYAAASRLGLTETGTARVRIRAIDPAAPPRLASPPQAPSDPSDKEASTLHLQVGAFRRLENARRIKARIASLPGLDAIDWHLDEDAGQALYRVRTGPVTDEQMARRLVHTLNEAGFDQVRLVGGHPSPPLSTPRDSARAQRQAGTGPSRVRPAQ